MEGAKVIRERFSEQGERVRGGERLCEKEALGEGVAVRTAEVSLDARRGLADGPLTAPSSRRPLLGRLLDGLRAELIIDRPAS